MAGLVLARPGHPRFVSMLIEDVDARDKRRQAPA
jgi:hypothetical protein